jgi:hypothetical protein
MVGRGEVSGVAGNCATLDVTLADGVATLPQTCEAVPLTSSMPRRAVAVAANGPGATVLKKSLGRSPRLRVAAAAEPVLATIRDDTNGWMVEDAVGVRLRTEPLGHDEIGRRRAVELVELLAAAERLCNLPSGEGPASFDVPVEIQLLRHTEAGTSACAPNGEPLFVGDRVSLTIRNCSDSVVNAWLFDIGVSNRTTLVTNDAPAGVRLAPAGTAGDTRTIGGQAGSALEWPEDVPSDVARSELFVILLANKEQDLRPLETPIGTARRAPGEPVSVLDALLEEARSGTREFPAQLAVAPVRYRWRGG